MYQDFKHNELTVYKYQSILSLYIDRYKVTFCTSDTVNNTNWYYMGVPSISKGVVEFNFTGHLIQSYQKTNKK